VRDMDSKEAWLKQKIVLRYKIKDAKTGMHHR
jgi:hypothetical protein